MFVRYLSLANFRNYLSLELELPPGLVVFQGANAQGKTNLLEAVYLLATTRSPRASAERELINWLALREEPVFARLRALVQRSRRSLEVEIALAGSGGGEGTPEDMPLYVQKRIKIDGVPRRTLDLVGQINVVWFSSQDIDLLGGAPALRRRYLDATLSQVDSRYLRALQSYSKVLVQRNNLLRLIREGRARTEELAFWDGELVREGSYLIGQRQGALSALTPQIASTHSRLSGQPPLEIKYLPSVPPGGGPVEQAFRGQLAASLSREVAQGMTLVGPHRDELRFLLQGIDMGLYGSRGEQRTVALSLKLAEALFLKETTGEEPVLLLDDVLSELDLERRRHLLETASTYQQVLLTTTDLDRIEPPFLEQATRFWVRGGGVEPG